MSRFTLFAASATTLLLLSAAAPAQVWPPTKPPSNPPPTQPATQPGGQPATQPSGQPAVPPSAQSPGPPAEAPPADPPPAPPPVDESLLGGPGESCRARADCKMGLKCLKAVCADPHQGESCMATADCGGALRCVQNVCGGPASGPSGPGAASGPGTSPGGEQEPEKAGSGWSDFRIGEGFHPFVGVVVLPGMSLVHDYFSGFASDVEGAFLFGVKGGMLFGTTELAVEISPMTYLPFTAGPADPVFQANFTVGSHLTLTDEIRWPLRFGVGVAAVNIPTRSDVAFLSRFDLLGLSFNYGHLLIDAHFPSFRFGTDFDQGGVFNWLFGVGAAYVF